MESHPKVSWPTTYLGRLQAVTDELRNIGVRATAEIILGRFSGVTADQVEATLAALVLFGRVEKMGDLLANHINAAEAKQHYQKGLKITEAILGTNASPQVSQLHLSLRAKLGLEQPELAILAVAPRSLARQLGLRPGDVLVSYAGQPIATVDQLNSLSGSIKGNEIEFEIRRDTAPLKFNVKAGSLGIRCEYRSVAKKADP